MLGRCLAVTPTYLNSADLGVKEGKESKDKRGKQAEASKGKHKPAQASQKQPKTTKKQRHLGYLADARPMLDRCLAVTPTHLDSADLGVKESNESKEMRGKQAEAGKGKHKPAQASQKQPKTKSNYEKHVLQ